jgi:predicted aminopeptidase
VSGGRRLERILRLAAAAAALPLSACSTVGYYGHLAHGEMALLAARKPVSSVLADPAGDAQLKTRLRTAQAAREFASTMLKLPRNRSYTSYADLHRPYATWNVFAAPEFSVEPLQHCFLLVGCLAYQGYFEQDKAEAAAAKLRTQGFETWIGGSAAHSTLGWFADPILNTMLRNDDDALASTIFHELAHQRLYVKGDTQFNESFATFVQREGLRQWHADRGLPTVDATDPARAAQFSTLVLGLRDRLHELYGRKLAAAVMREHKREEIASFRRDYARVRDVQWGGKGEYDGWVAAEINNAKLVPFGVYDGWVPAFAALYERHPGDWGSFFAAARDLARLAPKARAQALERLASSAH